MNRALGGGLSRRWVALILFGLGAGAALGQAPWGLWPLTLICLALAFAAAAPRRRLTYRRAFLRGWLLGLGYFAVALHWIVEPFLVDIAVHGWMAPFALLFMAAGGAVFWGVGFCLAVLLGQGALSKRGLVVGLTVAEMARALLFTGFPWALIGHVWIDTPVALVVAYVGPHGLTFLTLCAAAVWSTPRWRGGRVLAVVSIVALLWGMMPVAMLRDQTASVSRPVDADPLVRLVQPNARQDLKWDPAHRDQFFNAALAMTAADPRPDLIVWPETSVPYEIETGGAALRAVAEAGTPVVVGGLRRQGPFYYNTLAVIGAGGQISDSYDKSHLVPFGEYIPYAALMQRLGLTFGLVDANSRYGSGDGLHLVDIPGVGAALPLICYEGIFAEEVNGAGGAPRLILLITNDAWFGTYAGPAQHFAQARLRAIEQGAPVVRAANTGISAVIDPYGRVVRSIALNVEGAIDVRLPPRFAAPLYTRLGDWPIGALVVAWAMWARFDRRRVLN